MRRLATDPKFLIVPKEDVLTCLERFSHADVPPAPLALADG